MGVEEQGLQKKRYQVIPRTLVFIFRGEKVLLIKGAAKKKIWANIYNGIGGHIERGEDVFHAMQREIHEETGLTGIDLELRGTIMIDVEETAGINIYVFRGKFKSGELIASKEGRLEWIPIIDLYKYPLVKDVTTLIELVQAQPKEMFYARYYYQDGEMEMQFYSSGGELIFS